PEVLDEIVAVQSEAKEIAQQAQEGRAERSRGKNADKTVRTSVERLDNLMNLVGELITDRNRLNLIRSLLETRFHGEEQIEAVSETITHVGRITDQLQAEVMGIRMLPISAVFNKFPRLVRDLARKANKQVDLVMRGEDTELDRSVIEEISDPLIHLLRNSVDHGLETPEERLSQGKTERGVILLTARHEQGRIILTVEDDGRGIDLERVKAKAVEKGLVAKADAEGMSQEEAIDLIFASGLSTARVVSDVSGRGVGMDIVRNNIERLNGQILVETWPGRGTQFQIVLPLTLAIVPTLLVRVGVGTYAIPLVTVTETLRVPITDIYSVKGKPVIVLRDHVLPVSRLSQLFALSRQPNGGDGSGMEYIVVVRSGKTQMGLIVDSLVGEEEVVVKSLSTIVGDINGVSSAAILGDGQVALILDVQGLFKLVNSQQSSGRK
ncbi:MAG: chemotaxis protein CheA, partial [Chloroflexi bacterium]|nr:chemotaxis protein CheA [Chloroflexota bacterium]